MDLIGQLRRRAAMALCTLLLPALPALATEPVPAVDEEVLVVGQRGEDQPRPGLQDSLSGEALRRRVESTLGATLESQPGVHNASFGPGVGLPVIRGLTGNRLRMVQNDLGSHDASDASPDHAVAIEPLLAEEIRILRGAETIRHGSSAIGGAIEVRDNRIPRQLPERVLTGAVEARYGDNPDGHAAVFKVDAGAGFLAAHVEGFHRESGRVAIPGEALDSEAVREQFGEGLDFTNTDGHLINANAEAHGGAVGASLVGRLGYAGMAVSTFENNYGIPPGGLPPHSDIPGVLPDIQRIRIDMRQGRTEFAAALTNPLNGIEELSLRTALVDYRHREGDTGSVAATWRNAVTEHRLERKLRVAEAAPGTLGVQHQDRDFEAVGFETFVPATSVQSTGVYAVQHAALGPLELEAGGRYEWTSLAPRDTVRTVGGITPVPLPEAIDFGAASVNLGLSLQLLDSLRTRLGFTRAERAPDVQELLALGPHLSTRSFDIGNPELDVETAWMIDAGLVWFGPGFTFEADLFWRRIEDFIYQENLGIAFDVEDQQFRVACVRLDRCVSAFGYAQRDAQFTGGEMRLSVPLRLGATALDLSLFADSVRGYFLDEGAGSVPRLPPVKAGAAAQLDRGRWTAGLRLTRALAQPRAGLNETGTPAYTLLNADLGLRLPAWGGGEATAFLRGRNLLNEEIRNSTSFLRSFMPEPGRRLELVLRLEL